MRTAARCSAVSVGWRLRVSQSGERLRPFVSRGWLVSNETLTCRGSGPTGPWGQCQPQSDQAGSHGTMVSGPCGACPRGFG